MPASSCTCMTLVQVVRRVQRLTEATKVCTKLGHAHWDLERAAGRVWQLRRAVATPLVAVVPQYSTGMVFLKVQSVSSEFTTLIYERSH